MKKARKKTNLIKKSRPELQVFAKKLGAKNISKSTKNALIKFILENSDKENLVENKVQKLNKSFFKSWIFIFLTTIIIPTGIYYLSPSNDDVKEIIDERFQQYEKKELKLDEYIEQINNLSKVNKKFLERIFQNGHKVYGTKDGKFFEIYSYKNRKITSNFSSSLIINKETRRATLTIFIDELITSKQKASPIVSSTITKSFFLNNIGDLIRIPGISVNNETYFYFVLLNNDLFNPVFSIGISNYLHK